MKTIKRPNKKNPVKKVIKKKLSKIPDKILTKKNFEKDEIKSFDVKLVRNDDGIVQIHLSNILKTPSFTGLKNIKSAYRIVETTISTAVSDIDLNNFGKLEIKGSTVLRIMSEMQPQNPFEGLLISNMTIVWSQAMKLFKIANQNITSSFLFEKYQNQGIKLMRLYNQQLETLDKHRRKGNQKMTVEHIHIHKGAQAIVGDVHQGGGGKQ